MYSLGMVDLHKLTFTPNNKVRNGVVDFHKVSLTTNKACAVQAAAEFHGPSNSRSSIQLGYGGTYVAAEEARPCHSLSGISLPFNHYLAVGVTQSTRTSQQHFGG